MHPRLPLWTVLVIPAAAAILVMSSTSVALAAATEIRDNAPAPASQTRRYAFGPLELFPEVTAGVPPVRSADPAPESQTPAVQDEIVLNLVRDKMSPTDRAALDELVAAAQTRQQDVEFSQSIVDTAQEELTDLADAYLLEPGGGAIGAAPAAGVPPGGSAAIFQVSLDWIFPVAGRNSFGDSFGAPRYAGGYHPHRGVTSSAPATPLSSRWSMG